MGRRAMAQGGFPEPSNSNFDVAVVLALTAFSWQGVTKLPIILKGIQCVEDVELAHEHGASGVVLSNHGVRIEDSLGVALNSCVSFDA